MGRLLRNEFIFLKRVLIFSMSIKNLAFPPLFIFLIFLSVIIYWLCLIKQHIALNT